MLFRSVRVHTRGTGSEPYPPHLWLGLRLYSYATGTFSRRRPRAALKRASRTGARAEPVRAGRKTEERRLEA